jgi:hypothetical protein
LFSRHFFQAVSHPRVLYRPLQQFCNTFKGSWKNLDKNAHSRSDGSRDDQAGEAGLVEP